MRNTMRVYNLTSGGAGRNSGHQGGSKCGGTFTSPSINGDEVAARDKPGDMHIVSQE